MVDYCPKKKHFPFSRVVASGVAFLVVLASIPEVAVAHGRYGSCGRSYSYGYPRRYANHWNHWNNWNHCGSRSCGRRYYGYNPALELFDNLFHVGMNSLARQERRNHVVEEKERERRNQERQQERRNLVVEEREQPRYFVEDYGRNGLELTVEVPGMKARDIDVEIVQKDGVNTIVVNGSPGSRRRRGSTVRSKFSKSFVINDDDDINVDGITARVSSGNLVISMPRKLGGYGNRVIPSVVKDRSFADNSNSGDEILVYDAKRRSLLGGNKRSARQAVIVEEPLRKTTEKSNVKKREENAQDDDDLYISEEEDIW